MPCRYMVVAGGDGERRGEYMTIPGGESGTTPDLDCELTGIEAVLGVLELPLHVGR